MPRQGAPTANAYVTTSPGYRLPDHAPGYGRLDGSQCADQQAALQWATRLLDEQVQWYGIPTYPDQALALPAGGVGGSVGATTSRQT